MHHAPAPVLCIPLVLDGTCLIGFIGWRKYAGIWYDPKLGGLVDRTLEIFSRDMATNAKVSGRIDFRPHDHASKLKLRRRSESVESEILLVDPWLTLTGRFLDGSLFRLAAVEGIW